MSRQRNSLITGKIQGIWVESSPRLLLNPLRSSVFWDEFPAQGTGNFLERTGKWNGITANDAAILWATNPFCIDGCQPKHNHHALLGEGALGMPEHKKTELRIQVVDDEIVVTRPATFIPLPITSPSIRSGDSRTVAAQQRSHASARESPGDPEPAPVSPSLDRRSPSAALGDVEPRHRLERRLPLLLGRQPFPRRSFSTALSSSASASSRFCRAFSVSSVFSRRTSDTSRPPYLAFHL